MILKVMLSWWETSSYFECEEGKYSPIEKRRRAGIRTGHVAVVALRLGIGRLLLVVVHGLLVVRPAVLFQSGLRQTAVVLRTVKPRQSGRVVAGHATSTGRTC